MKPTYETTGYGTMDLTLCPIHVKPDGSLIALVPMKWTASEPRDAMGANGTQVSYRHYVVSEFKEVQIAPPGTAVQTPPSNT